MKHRLGKEVYTIGKPTWSRMRWGRIVAIGDAQHYIVKYDDGRKAWIHKTKEIILYR